MRTSLMSICALLATAGLLGSAAERDLKLNVDVELALESTPKGGKQTRTLRVAARDQDGERRLVYGPMTRGGNEGWDLGFDILILWGPQNTKALTTATLLYRRGTTFAYRLVNDDPTRLTTALVVVSDNEAKVLINDHWLTNVPQHYSIVAKYHHYHEGLLDHLRVEQQWTKSKRLKVEIGNTP